VGGGYKKVISENLKAARYVTITFDDGLINGAQRTAAIFDAFGLKATFYVVTGWVGPHQITWIRDRWNWRRDHDTW
jgi:peptidoglycan/xylan/chitin deacetylase (PgdA/CDA1 family)